MIERNIAPVLLQLATQYPVITLTGVIAPAKPATEGKPAQPERKFARMAIRAKNPTPPSVG